MIRDRAVWQRWEAEYQAHEVPDFEKNLQWLEAIYMHARALRVLPLAEPTDGLDTKIRLARALNVPTAARDGRTSS